MMKDILWVSVLALLLIGVTLGLLGFGLVAEAGVVALLAVAVAVLSLKEE